MTRADGIIVRYLLRFFKGSFKGSFKGLRFVVRDSGV